MFHFIASLFFTISLSLGSLDVCSRKINNNDEHVKNYCIQSAQRENISDVDPNVYYLKDLGGNVFYAVKGIESGFRIYDSISGKFLEKSSTMISPFDFSNNRENYYFGPLEYYYKKDGTFYSYYDGKSYSFSYREETQKEFEEKLSVLRLPSSEESNETNTISPQSVVVNHNFYIDNYQYIRDAKYPENYEGSCGYVAASIVLYYWSKTADKSIIPNNYLDSNGQLNDIGRVYDPNSNLKDKLVSIAGKADSWGKEVADTLNKYCKEFNIKGSAGYGLLDYGIQNELSKEHPVILFGSRKRPSDGKRINHAVTCYGFQRYGTGPHPSSFYYIVNYGWQESSTSEVLLNGAMLGSVTYFGLDGR